jgi:soluble P-type ATPase
MLVLDVPGRGQIQLSHLVLDLNGTLAVDGRVPESVARRLRALSERLHLHVVTADTFGTAAGLEGLGARVHVLPPGDHVEAKAAFVRALGAATAAAIGNGSNDVLMLREAALGVAVVGREGAAGAVVGAAEIVVTRIQDALDLLLMPTRLIATLRTR